MSEGLLGALAGDEDEKPDGEASDARAGAEAFAAAIAAIASRQDPQVARDTSAFLGKQSQLLETQNRHLKAEHSARLHFLQGQAREVDLRRLGLRLRVGFQIFVALLATAVGISLILVVRDAVTSRSVVIDPIDIAPNLAAQVPSGKIVASGLLDVLTNIQAANKGSAEHRSLSNAWTSEIAIDVPETGVSIGQIERALKTRFGHDQHIDGDLVQTDKGRLALTVRGAGILPKTFTDEARDLPKLLQQAGEYVYAQSQPGLWGSYLTENDRNDEAIRFVQGAYAKVDPGERPYLLNTWANAITNEGADGAWALALPLWRESVRLKPDYWAGYSNIIAALSEIGDEEGVVREAEKLTEAAGGRPGRAPESHYEGYDVAIWDLNAARASSIADMEATGGIGTNGVASGAESLNIAQLEVQLHDVDAAALRLQTTRVDTRSFPDVAAAAFARALLAEEGGDLKAAAQQWDAFAAAYANPVVSSHGAPGICYAAVTYERTGQTTKADAALRPRGGGRFVDCYRFSGDVLDLRGDWAGAAEWYANAVKLGPSIPSGYYSWGVALAKHGDLPGAAAKLENANRTGPHWADPLKAWGDVLLRQGKIREAASKYDEALKFAPNWKELKDVRDSLAKQKN